MLVNLHIIGVQKAGTTALASFLNQHPAIHVVKGKEAHVFDDPNFNGAPDKQVFAEQKYQQRLPQYQQQALICDATPITLFNPQFLQDCYHYNPEAKFIVLLRDPIERAISHYHMTKSRNQEPRCMLFAFLFEAYRLRNIDYCEPWHFDSPNRTQSYLMRGRYSRQLEYLFKLIPAQQILIINQRDLNRNHHQTMLAVFSFLNIHRHTIKSEQVFASPPIPAHKSDVLARWFAKIYFALHRETPARWHKIIKRFQA